MSRLTNLVTLSSIVLAGCVPAAPQARIDHPAVEPPPPVDVRVTANEAPPPRPTPAPAVSVRPTPALDDIHDRCRQTRAYPTWCREQKLRLRKIPSDPTGDE